MPAYMNELISTIDLNQNQPLYRIIYESLRTAIIKGVIPMGERINEKKYARALNVSRTPVRVALQRLEDEGIVKHVPNYGIVVTQITEKDITEIYKIRVALDILASVNAAKLMTKDREEIVRELLNQTIQAHESGQIQKVTELAKEFNQKIYEFAEMPHLQAIQKRLHDYLARFRDVSLMSDKRREAAIKEHELIFDAMCAGELEQMEKLITKHLQRSKSFIRLEMEEMGKND